MSRSLYTISFDSDEDEDEYSYNDDGSGKEGGREVEKRKGKDGIGNSKAEKDSNAEEDECDGIVRVTAASIFEPKKKQKVSNRRFRNIGGDEPVCRPTVVLTSVETIVVKRRKRPKLNGVRYYFSAYANGQQIMLAKARSLQSKQIIITSKPEIHLSALQDVTAYMSMESDNTDFTLIEHGERNQHFLAVRFAAPKPGEQSNRRMYVSFFGLETNFPALSSVSPTEIMNQHEGTFNQSIKNAVLADDRGRVLIVIRKSAGDELSIDSKLGMDHLWLFALGLAAFQGKRPTR